MVETSLAASGGKDQSRAPPKLNSQIIVIIWLADRSLENPTHNVCLYFTWLRAHRVCGSPETSVENHHWWFLSITNTWGNGGKQADWKNLKGKTGEWHVPIFLGSRRPHTCVGLCTCRGNTWEGSKLSLRAVPDALWKQKVKDKVELQTTCKSIEGVY